MNASVSVHHEAVLREEDARLEAPITPRRKLVVPSVFIATPKTSNKSFSKGSPEPKKLKIPLAFATAPTTFPFHMPKNTVTLQQLDPCEKRVSDVVEGPSPVEEETPLPNVDCATVEPRTTLDPIAALIDDPLPPTTPLRKSSPQKEASQTLQVDCTAEVPFDPEKTKEPAVTKVSIDDAQSPPTSLKGRRKKKTKSVQDMKRREVFANQKRELMEQLLSLNTRIEAAKQRSRRNLEVEEVLIAFETSSIDGDEKPAPVCLVELIDDPSSEKANEEARIEEVATAHCPKEHPNDRSDQQDRETTSTEVSLLPTLVATEVPPSKALRIRKLSTKRLVRLGSFFARRRKSRAVVP